MITREAYLEALNVVEAYHRQLKESVLEAKPSLAESNIKRGDLLTYIGGSNSKYLIKGNRYKTTSEPFVNGKGDMVIPIINDGYYRMVTKLNYFTKD